MVKFKCTWRRFVAAILGLILGYLAAGYAQHLLPGTAANAARTTEMEDEDFRQSDEATGVLGEQRLQDVE